jgi:hypothetical protein
MILTPEYNCNIQKLKEYIVVLEEDFNAQTAYMACRDADLVRFANDEYARWEQGQGC